MHQTELLFLFSIGCGNGAFTAQIVEKCTPSKVDGIDPSDAQINYAQNRNLPVPVNFQIGDAMALPYATDSFDIGELNESFFSNHSICNISIEKFLPSKFITIPYSASDHIS